MLRFLGKLPKKAEKLGYNYFSDRIRELLDILNSKYELKIIGQEEMNERLVMALILNEHILLEGLPGVAKTTAIKNMANETALFFNRVQFIPDMQPSDLIGKRDLKLEVDKEHFQTHWVDGPLFTNLLLADEINRAPAKVQAALLEAMGERQITPFGQQTKIIRYAKEYGYIENHYTPPFGTDKIDPLNKNAVQFNVFATMNPIEQEGTYPLSEAQVDRFCFKTLIYYPNKLTLKQISMKVLQDYQLSFQAVEEVKKSDEERMQDQITSLYFLRECRKKIFERDGQGGFRYMKPDMIEKIANIVYFSNYKLQSGSATNPYAAYNDPEQLEIRMNMMKPENEKAKQLATNDLFRYIESGSSPRAQESLIKASLCQAFMDGDQMATEKHLRKIIYDVMRHRIRMNIQARTQKTTSIDVINTLMETFL